MANNNMHITIEVPDGKTQMEVATKIHNQLVGNKDYVESNIVLNTDTKNEINLYIDNCKGEVPTICL